MKKPVHLSDCDALRRKFIDDDGRLVMKTEAELKQEQELNQEQTQSKKRKLALEEANLLIKEESVHLLDDLVDEDTDDDDDENEMLEEEVAVDGIVDHGIDIDDRFLAVEMETDHQNEVTIETALDSGEYEEELVEDEEVGEEEEYIITERHTRTGIVMTQSKKKMKKKKIGTGRGHLR